MTTSKLPARPSLESLRKQAKKLARDCAAGDAGALARVRVQAPHLDLPLSVRDAQLVLAREYGFAGWQDLVGEVQLRCRKGPEWAVTQARHRIHDNDVDGLRRLLAEFPGLLSWRADDIDGGLLGMATGAFGDCFDPSREQTFTRTACAELLIDAGAAVAPSVCEGLIESRARGLLALFQRKELLPRSLKFLAALGDSEGIRSALAKEGNDLASVSEGFRYACHLRQADAAEMLLDRAVALDGELGRRIEGGPGRTGFVRYIMENSLAFTHANPPGLWEGFVMREVVRAVNEGELQALTDLLRREAWLLSEAQVAFRVGLVERAVLRDREEVIRALLDFDPTLGRRRVPPPSQALEFAFTYGKTHLLPVLLRIWPMPADLPHAAGNGDLAGVKKWFDAEGNAALGDLENHFPANSPFTLGNLQWGEPKVQHVLDTALAWAVINNHFEIGDFLLAHGADINTNWGSHEPASILHDLTHFHRNYEAMQFLIDRGIDLTIQDYRWHSTAQGWAQYAVNDEKMAHWLGEAQKRREQGSQ